ncbi:MAG: hypothetical protein PHG82_01435 [Candidatus Gracilibacteria bacterium]|nr:hypothetical protein [Candidatus Gracilibacteria bacterium]
MFNKKNIIFSFILIIIVILINYYFYNHYLSSKVAINNKIETLSTDNITTNTTNKNLIPEVNNSGTASLNNEANIIDKNLIILKKYIISLDAKYKSKSDNLLYIKDIINFILDNPNLKKQFITDLSIKTINLDTELGGKSIDYDNIGFLLSSVYNTILIQDSSNKKFSQYDCIKFLSSFDDKSLINYIFSFKTYYSDYIKSPYYNHDFVLENLNYSYSLNKDYLIGKKISYSILLNNNNDYSFKGLSKIIRCDYFPDKNACNAYKINLANSNKSEIIKFSHTKEFNIPVIYIDYLLGNLTKNEFINKLCLK